MARVSHWLVCLEYVSPAPAPTSLDSLTHLPLYTPCVSLVAFGTVLLCCHRLCAVRVPCHNPITIHTVDHVSVSLINKDMPHLYTNVNDGRDVGFIFTDDLRFECAMTDDGGTVSARKSSPIYRASLWTHVPCAHTRTRTACMRHTSAHCST